MTFLPIVERELRVRARSPAAYWTRFAVVLVGVLICLPQLAATGPFNSAPTGAYAFNEIVAAAFVLCCAACLLTSDAISGERREGTLGLLFLTRVNRFDVLIGKLGSTGLTSLCALVALLPVLVVPLLAGGVTGGEALRKGLVLLNTLFLALGAGLYASASHQESFRAARQAVSLVTVYVLVPYLASLMGFPLVLFVSPLASLGLAGDSAYKQSHADYFTSLAAGQSLAWVLLIRAGVRLRQTVRQASDVENETCSSGRKSAPFSPADGQSLTSAATVQRIEPPTISEGLFTPHALVAPEPSVGGTRTTFHPPPLASSTPIEWLVHRQRGVKAAIWSAAIISVLPQTWLFAPRFIRSPRTTVMMTQLPGLAVSILSGVLFAWAAGRFFLEARRTGELELLRTTPLGAATFVSDQWNALKKLLRWPVLVMLFPVGMRLIEFIAFAPSFSLGPLWHRGRWALLNFVTSALSLPITVLGVMALCWTALWFGLKASGQAMAITRTVVLAKGAPYLTSLATQVLVTAALGPSIWPITYFRMVGIFLPQIAILLLYIWLIRIFRRRLLCEQATPEAGSFNLRRALSEARQNATDAIRKARHWTPG